MAADSYRYRLSPTFQIEFSAGLFNTDPEKFLTTTFKNRSFVLNSCMANSKRQKKIKKLLTTSALGGRWGLPVALPAHYAAAS
ncbi:hypothetical protein ACFFJ3_03965 [Serratia aquatilis]|uniref:Uncharacterized protein n=1 Tax=Serratia aquatilis TaxID=1737515 RepID=A0ABV6E9W9_9GAMM